MVRLFLFSFLLFGISSCEPAPSFHIEISGHQIDSGGVTLWYNQPSSVYFSGQFTRTYFAYLNRNNGLAIRHFDFASKRVSPPEIVDSWDSADDHGAPILWVKKFNPNKGKLIMFYSYHSSPMFYRLSNNSESIDSWGVRKLLDEGACTYGSIVEDMEGNLYVFYTLQTDRRVFVRRMSNDGGLTWSNPQTVIDFGAGTFIYAAPVAIEENRMAIAWAVYRREGDQRGHKDIFTAVSDNGTEWQIGGIKTSLITSENATPVIRTPVNRENIVWDVGFDKDSMPVIVYIEHAPYVPNIGWDDCYVNYLSYKRSNKEWIAQRLTTIDSNVYPAGAILNPKDHNNVLVGGKKSVTSWQKLPSNNWFKQEVITASDTSTYFNPVIPEGSVQRQELFWINVKSYIGKDYNASLNYFCRK